MPNLQLQTFQAFARSRCEGMVSDDLSNEQGDEREERAGENIQPTGRESSLGLPGTPINHVTSPNT